MCSKKFASCRFKEIEQLINDTLHALDDFLVERGRVYDIYGIKNRKHLMNLKSLFQHLI